MEIDGMPGLSGRAANSPTRAATRLPCGYHFVGLGASTSTSSISCRSFSNSWKEHRQTRGSKMFRLENNRMRGFPCCSCEESTGINDLENLWIFYLCAGSQASAGLIDSSAGEDSASYS